MSTYKTRLTIVQRAAAQAQSPAFTVSTLLDLYLATPSQQRDEQFVSTARAAEFAGVSQRTIQFWIGIGLVRAIRVGKQYRVSLDSLRKYFHKPIDE